MKYQWYVFIDIQGQIRREWPAALHCRYNLGGPRDRPPNWRERLYVWSAMAVRYGRLCWHSVY